MPSWLPIAFSVLQTLAFVALAIDRWVHGRESAETALSLRVLAMHERMTSVEGRLDRFLGKQSDLADVWQKKFSDIEIIQAVQREHIEHLTRDMSRMQRL